jgi:hypothetical protein
MAELTQVDVEAMVRDARAGDTHALGRLYDTYRDRVAGSRPAGSVTRRRRRT